MVHKCHIEACRLMQVKNRLHNWHIPLYGLLGKTRLAHLWCGAYVLKRWMEGRENKTSNVLPYDTLLLQTRQLILLYHIQYLNILCAKSVSLLYPFCVHVISGHHTLPT